MFKVVAFFCFLAISASAQHHGATSFTSSNLGLGEKYTKAYVAAPQYYSAPSYVQKYNTPVVAKIPIATYKNYEHEEHDAPAHYEFKYAVEDKHTGDIKSQHEIREGDVVKGEYSLHEADGTIRTVKYTADKHNGFNAVVERSGHAVHQEVVPVKAVHQVPVVHQTVGVGHGLGYYH